METMASDGLIFDAIRLRSFPFSQTVEDFIQSHEKVFIIEQNRDGQMRSLLINELNVNPQKMVPVLNYDGMPITAHTIISLISKNLSPALNGSTSKILS
jgi:2-oxoglutarate ferredoxin oxidoreductase subunit alpha